MAKIRFSIRPIIWRFLKSVGLLADVAAKDMPIGGLYVTNAETGAMNIRGTGKAAGINDEIEPIYGNTYVYSPDAAVAQNKLFRLYVDITDVTPSTDVDFDIGVHTPTGTDLITSSSTATITDIATILAGIDTVISAFAPLSPVVTTTATGTFTGYLDIEFQSAPYFNYELIAEVTSGLMTLEVVVTQESVDPSMTGEWKLIGSNDRIGDCFQFWTTRYGLTSSMDIVDVTNPAATTIQIEVADTTGLVDGQSVLIANVGGVPSANGEWMITNITATTFDLILTPFAGAYTSGGTVTTNIYGLGEIGVASQDNNGVTSYVRLLRSNEFNFSTLKQIDDRAKRKQDSNVANYFTDNFNPPRVFYYEGAYTTDGAITSGAYSYGSINEDLQLLITAVGFGIHFYNQIQTGGSVKSGNWRYSARFLTNELSPSIWLPITQTVSTFSANISGDPNVLWGDDENIVTPKQNVLEIVNQVPGLFKFVEIAGINYIGNSYTGFVIGRYVLDGNVVQYITHTGNENAITDLDIGELSQVLPPFELARNVELIDSRLVLSNLTPPQVIDFTAWVETWEYSIDRDRITPIGVYNSTNDGLAVGEYQLPINSYTYKSHMIYETYRYGAKFILKNGLETPVFYPGYDIRIDMDLTQTGRVAGTFTSFDLTDIAAQPTDVYTILINWQNVDMSFLIDGIPVSELIEQIIICRAQVVPTVLANGVVMPGITGDNTASTNPAFTTFWYGEVIAGPTHVNRIGPFPYFSGYTNISPVGLTPLNNPTYDQQTVGAPYEDPQRDSAFFFSPDISFGQTTILYSPGDQLISFGAAIRHDEFSDLQPVTILESDYSEYNGYTNITANPTAYVINDALFAGIGENSITVDGKDHTLKYSNSAGILAYRNYLVDQCIVLGLASNLINDSANTDYGMYQALYYRPLADQYGDPRTTTYTEFARPHNINGETGIIPAGDLITYGDVFTQKTYLKFRNPGEYTGSDAMGFGVGVGYYSQNRANLQLRRKPTPTYNDSVIIPNYLLEDWLRIGTNHPGSVAESYVGGRDAQFFYNQGYTPRNNVTTSLSFDSTLNYQSDWGNVVVWSASEVDGSNTDYLRVFPPLNIKFLDYTFGRIMDARNVNGELITLQESQVVRQYFNTTEVEVTELGSEVILGDGGVMRRKGQVLTSFGPQHKWSVLVVKSDKGFDVLLFIDVINKTICRYGYNGNDAIDEIDGMKVFFANNLQWITGKDTPAHEEGIHGVPNQRFREVIWTFRGWKSGIAAWEDIDYVIGDVVSISPGENTFEQTPDFYVAAVDGPSGPPTIDNTDWTWITHTNKNYYSEFTICYDLLNSRFISFWTPKPRIYAKFRNGYLVPRSISDTGRVYISDTGVPTSWFAGGSPSQTGDAFFDAVINGGTETRGRKRYLNVRVEAEPGIAPFRMDVTTSTQTTFTPVGLFVERPVGEFDAPVRNDATGTGIADGDTSSIFGDYAIVRLTIAATTYNRINNFVMKVRSLARQYFT